MTSSAPKPGYGRVIIDARFWADDLASSTPQARTAARAWRAAVEHDGVALSQLRPCDTIGALGKRSFGTLPDRM